MATTQGEIEERGDGEVGEAAKSLGCAAAGAPLHGLAKLPGCHRVELSRRGHVGAPWPPGCVTVNSSGLHGRLTRLRGTKMEASRCEWMRICDSEYELAYKD